MQVSFSKAAQIEVNEAVKYYNDQREGLGFDFANEIKLTLNRIVGFVDSWPKLSANTRRAIINRFPYGIVYSFVDNEILVIAVMHMRRKPDYWKSRIERDKKNNPNSQ